MPLAVVGVSHHTAPVEIRERMAFGPSEASRVLMELRRDAGVEEAVLLSTCNRTEIYLFPVHDPSQMAWVERVFASRAPALGRPAEEYLFRRQGEHVVEHLFQVSAGMDSMVTGEAEIQGQVREAYRLSAGLSISPPLTGPVLNRLFQMALSVGGQVRSETSIGEGAGSVASVAVELARKIFGQLRDRRILILGAGATAELMVEALAREGVTGVLVANRTYDRALDLAERLDGHAVPMEGLSSGLPSADIVLSSTAAPHPVLTRELFRRAFPHGRRHPLLIIDIAMPRDVEPDVGEEEDVFLYNVDDLRRIVDEHVKLRSEALPEASRIIGRGSREFQGWFASREVVPVIRRMREQAEAHRSAELDRLFGRLDGLSAEERGRVEEFSRRLLNKLLHQPTVRLRKGMARGSGTELVDAVRFLYGLENPETSTDAGRVPAAKGVPADGNVPGTPNHREPGAPEGDAPRERRNPQHGVVE